MLNGKTNHSSDVNNQRLKTNMGKLEKFKIEACSEQEYTYIYRAKRPSVFLKKLILVILILPFS